ncbi:hypothetical protein [Actinoplanes sp. NPDC026619]|uniref:hypothetical protein n=1 Tax=Actinoplanes sp. NPDC026619 TaxID=3155798 RepID=UPI0033EF3383
MAGRLTGRGGRGYAPLRRPGHHPIRRLAETGAPRPELNRGDVDRLREHLDQIWQHAHTIDPASERDLSQARHRDVFHRAVARCPGIGAELIAALYAVMPDQWIPFDDTLAVLRELKSRGVRIAVLSNIGPVHGLGTVLRMVGSDGA